MNWGCAKRIYGALLAFVIVALPAPASAETRALLAATWQYGSPFLHNLVGPENDIAAMEAIVRAKGASDVTVLRNAEVTRTSIESTLHAMGQRARPGDWIVFYYSGHGAQAEAAVKGTPDGDLDQFLPLAGFDLDHQDAERFVVDKDFYAWMSRYIPPSVHILMIADTCNSGSMNRSVDPAAFTLTPRLAYRGQAADIQLMRRPAPRYPPIMSGTGGPIATGAGLRALDRPDLPNLVYIGAAQDGQLASERSLPVSGAPSHGFLTWALEQGLAYSGADGQHAAADTNRDGVVTPAELGQYLDSQVRALSGQLQQPRTFYTANSADLPLFVSTAAPAPAPSLALPGMLALGSHADLLGDGGDAPWRRVSARSDADFTWDTDSGKVLRRTGDTVAEDVYSLPALAGVVAKWNAVEVLRPLINESALQIVIGPKANGARYAAGEKVSLVLHYGHTNAPHPDAPLYATIFNLAADGTVQVLYPLTAADGDGQLAPGGTMPLIQNRVVAPFGTDHVVALVLPHPPTDFRALLHSSDGQRLATRAVAPVRDLLLAAGGGLSIGEVYTGP